MNSTVVRLTVSPIFVRMSRLSRRAAVARAVSPSASSVLASPSRTRARIQRSPVEDETWYRVRIGPIETVEELQSVRAKLLEAEIDVAAVAPIEEAPLP